MGRKIIAKSLISTKLANSYGGWIYCDYCNETIGNLCYATYKYLHMEYLCKCGNKGNIEIELDEKDTTSKLSDTKMLTIRNRLCCSKDESPLLTILSKKVHTYSYQIVCKECNNKYEGDEKEK